MWIRKKTERERERERGREGERNSAYFFLNYHQYTLFLLRAIHDFRPKALCSSADVSPPSSCSLPLQDFSRRLSFFFTKLLLLFSDDR